MATAAAAAVTTYQEDLPSILIRPNLRYCSSTFTSITTTTTTTTTTSSTIATDNTTNNAVVTATTSTSSGGNFAIISSNSQRQPSKNRIDYSRSLSIGSATLKRQISCKNIVNNDDEDEDDVGPSNFCSRSLNDYKITNDVYSGLGGGNNVRRSSERRRKSSLISMIYGLFRSIKTQRYQYSPPHNFQEPMLSSCKSVPSLPDNKKNNNWRHYKSGSTKSKKDHQNEENHHHQSTHREVNKEESNSSVPETTNSEKRQKPVQLVVETEINIMSFEQPRPSSTRKSKESMDLQRKHALKELISTEREYIKDLSLIVDGYIKYMKDSKSLYPMPEDLKGGKDDIIFANVDSIYRWHRDTFANALESCLDKKQDFGGVFKKYENRLLMYVNYCQKKKLSEHIVSEHPAYFEAIRNCLNHKLQLSDLLIKPVQRITKYHLILQQIYQHTTEEKEKASLKEAQTIMQNILCTANILASFGCLKNFEGEIHLQGKLLHHGVLRCCEQNPVSQSSGNIKIKEYLGLLFEQSIIFSEQCGKEMNPDYIFRYQFMLNKMNLNDGILNDDKNEWFLLISTDCKKAPLSLYCCATISQERSKWVDNIRNIITANEDMIRSLIYPLAENSSKNKSIATKNSIRTNNNNNNNNNNNDNDKNNKRNNVNSNGNIGNGNSTGGGDDNPKIRAVTASDDIDSKKSNTDIKSDGDIREVTTMLETTL